MYFSASISTVLPPSSCTVTVPLTLGVLPMPSSTEGSAARTRSAGELSSDAPSASANSFQLILPSLSTSKKERKVEAS